MVAQLPGRGRSGKSARVERRKSPAGQLELPVINDPPVRRRLRPPEGSAVSAADVPVDHSQAHRAHQDFGDDPNAGVGPALEME